VTLRLRHHVLEPRPGRPLLMGIVNAGPDSFSDAVRLSTLDAQVAHARRLVAEGADIVDVGGKSGVTYPAASSADVEMGRVVPLVERLAADGIPVSVDTWKAEVAAAALDAGAAMINDTSGLRDLALAELCARTGAALVVMHTRAEPKGTLLDPGFYDDVIEDVRAFLVERMAVALGEGMAPEQLVVDPGPDFAKTPAQTVAVLQRLGELHELGRPLLLAPSNKDFVGALTGRPPRERLVGTLAAVAHGVDAGAHVLRVHDVAAIADFLRVRAALRGDRELAPDEGLTPDRYPR
jgi:dihydropteroate synthase